MIRTPNSVEDLYQILNLQNEDVEIDQELTFAEYQRKKRTTNRILEACYNSLLGVSITYVFRKDVDFKRLRDRYFGYLNQLEKLYRNKGGKIKFEVFKENKSYKTTSEYKYIFDLD